MEHLQDTAGITKTVERIEIFKDNWIVSKPWCANLVFNDGLVWKNWQNAWSSKREMVKNIQAVTNVPMIRIEDEV